MRAIECKHLHGKNEEEGVKSCSTRQDHLSELASTRLPPLDPSQVFSKLVTFCPSIRKISEVACLPKRSE